MDISSVQILAGLGVLEVVVGMFAAIGWWRIRRRVHLGSDAPPRRARHEIPARPRNASRWTPGVSDSGRHHVPEELLHARTHRLAADRLARARVPGTGSQAAL